MKWTNSYRSFGLKTKRSTGLKTIEHKQVTPVWSLYLHLPYGTTGLSPGDVAEITAATDPNLKGRKFRLLNMQSEKTHATACRWNVKEVGNSNEQ